MASRSFPAGPVLLATSFGMLVLYAWLARYANPMADDLAFAATGRSGGFLHLQVERWQLWNGRFSSNIPILCSPLVNGLGGLWLYRACSVLLMVLTVLVFRGLVRTWSHHSIRGLHAWTAALLLTMVQFTLMPNVGEGLYWYTGAMTYQTAVITGIAYLDLLLRARQRSWIGGRALHGTLMVLLLAAFVGSNEMSMAMAVLFHGGLGARTLLHRSEPRGLDLLLTTVAFAAAALMFFAPGNAGREEQYLGTHRLWYSLGMSAAQAVRFTGMWLLSPITVFGSLLLWTSYDTLPDEVRRSAQALRPYRWPLLVLPMALAFAAAYPAYWSTGILGQHRTMDQACGFFVPAWCLVVLVWRSAASKPPNAMEGSFLLSAVLPLLLALSLVLTGNGLKVMGDLLSGNAAAFDREMGARFQLLQHAVASSTTAVRVPPVLHQPRALMFVDLSTEPGFWVNQAHAQYFDLLDKRILLDRPDH